MRKTLALLFSFCMLGTFNVIFGKVYYVSPGGSGAGGHSWATAYKSPADALADVSVGAPVAGDEVWVQQGTYVSATTLSWKTGINFYGGFTGTETQRSQRSTNAALTILEGTNTNRVLNAPSMASPTTWSGFTIQKGSNSGGGAGIFMQKNAILENCIVQNNTTTDHGGGGVYVQGLITDTDSIKVLNCIVRNNLSTKSGAAKRGGGGIYVKQGSHKAVVRGCVIENNIVDGLANSGSDINGGGVYLADGTLENSIIRTNTATNKNASTQALSLNGKCQGGGVFIMPQTTANPIVVRNCVISGNAANTSVGGGIAIDPLWTSAITVSPVHVINTQITNNSAYKNGGGVMADGQAVTSTASYTFVNCVIANNESSAVAAGGRGVFINNIADYAGSVSFNHCTVVNNKMLTTNYGGAGIFYNYIKADISNSVFWGNGSVGTLAPYHVRVKNTLTTNKLINCAFDNRFVDTQVSPTGVETDLTGKVIVEQTNTGSTSGKKYASFMSPTNFVGKAITTADSESLEQANWLLQGTSGLIDAGYTSTATNDIFGVLRPKSNAPDIGAYEYSNVPVFVGAGSWETASYWNTGTVPGVSESAIIEGSATINSNVSLQSLSIIAGKSLTINAEKQLSVNGNLINNGTLILQNTAGIITTGTVSGSGISKVRQLLTAKTESDKTDNWWYISSPVTGATSASILVDGSANMVGYYNESDASYPQIKATNVILEPAKGYLAQINSTNTYEFAGTLTSGDVGPVSLTRTPAAEEHRGFNLVGNPYPSHINWNAITRFGTQNERSDIRPTVWVRTRTTSGTMDFDTFDGQDAVTKGKSNAMNGYIAPMQAFWVKVNEDNTTPTITFTNEMRSVENQSSVQNRLRVPGHTTRQILRIELSNGVNFDQTVISTHDAAHNGYDFYDSDKMSAANSAIPEIYSLVEGRELVIDKRKSIDAGAGALLGFSPGQTGTYTIKATEMVNLENVKVILKDNHLNTEIELQPNESYSFTSDVSASTVRFSVEFRAPGIVTADNELSAVNTLVYVNDANQIAVQSATLTKSNRISVFNLAGQQLASQQADGQLTIIRERFEAGAYLVKVNTHLQKVIVK